MVTLLPLPVIAWMIHIVRDRLRTGFEKVDRIWAEVTNVLADTIPGIRVVKRPRPGKTRGRPLPRGQPAQPGLNDRINKTWSLVSRPSPC